jgi:phosphoglycolate phosphatase-like HAD superfamily hydrolase
VYEILQSTMKSNGLEVAPEEFDKWHGTNKRDVIAHFVGLQARAHEAEAEQVTAEAAREALIQRVFDEFMAGIERAYFADDQDNVRVFPGVLDVTRKLRAAGIKVALNTGTISNCRVRVS